MSLPIDSKPKNQQIECTNYVKNVLLETSRNNKRQQKTWRKESGARKENNTINEGKRRTKDKFSELKRRVKKHKKRQSMDMDDPTEDDIQEVLLIEDDGNSTMPSPVILSPEFFN